MTFLRRYLRSFAVVWLSCQVASLSALAPQNCCPAHRLAGEGEPDCHKTGDDTCPMHAATGQACPTHASDSPDTRLCVMRGTCEGPAIALASLFSVHGILVERTQMPFDATSSLLIVAEHRATPFLVSHDTPPPRL
jgi:hypothetical protein